MTLAQVPLDVALRELAEVHSAQIVLVWWEHVIVVGQWNGAEITMGSSAAYLYLQPAAMLAQISVHVGAEYCRARIAPR